MRAVYTKDEKEARREKTATILTTYTALSIKAGPLLSRPLPAKSSELGI